MKKVLTIWFIFLLSEASNAQQELVLPLQNSIPQSNLINPGLMMEKEGWSISLPSLSFNFAHTGFTYNDLIRPRPQDDSLEVNFDNALGRLSDHNYIFAHYNINFTTLNYKKGNSQFGFSVSDKVSAAIKYPKELPQLIWEGNEQYLGETIDIGPEIKAMKYREWAFSYSYDFGKLQIGLRGKYLQGLADISTSRNQFTLHTDTSDYALTVASDYQVNTSNPGAFEEIISPFKGTLNRGWGLDLGLNYQPSEKISLAFSLLDIGQIKWQSNVTNYISQGQFTFDGIDVFSYIQSDTVSFEESLDSLENTFAFKTTNESYYTQLMPRSFLSIKYHPDSLSFFAFQVYSEYIEGIHPAFTLGYSRDFIKPLKIPVDISSGVYWSYRNRSFYNLGVGLSIRYKFLQFFLAGDNLLSFFFPKAVIPFNRLQPIFKEDSNRSLTLPKHLKNYNFRVGINIRLK